MKKYRIYVDTSVFGGAEDDEFRFASRKFFERVHAGHFLALISDLVLDELAGAPQAVRDILAKLPASAVQIVEISDEAKALAQAYVIAGALGKASMADATHVAVATVVGADLIVSWNFKHIVNFDRIKKFNGVNSLQGYFAIDIRSPLEVAYDEQE